MAGSDSTPRAAGSSATSTTRAAAARSRSTPSTRAASPPGRGRPTLTDRSITVRYLWSDLVDAWADQDQNAIDEIWDDIITDLDSDYAAYAYVSSVGIGA
ncbi:hypothetical protein ABZT43_48630 [Streptomyces sp. NPDC005349]|uniref:hypothetical protein n=1 Tax=Streptomyces sp. NPDC005349 TaxID=3157037 RepID=UPI0033B5B3D8